VAAVAEHPAHLVQFLGRALRVEAEPAGHGGGRQCLDLRQPQQRGIRFLHVPQPAQGERPVQGWSRKAGGLLGVEPQAEFGVEAIAQSPRFPDGGRLAYGGQEQRYSGQPGCAGPAPEAPAAGLVLRGTRFAYAERERLGGQLAGMGGSAGTEIGVRKDRVPALREQSGLGGILRGRQVWHGWGLHLHPQAGSTHLGSTGVEGTSATGPEFFTAPAQLTSGTCTSGYRGPHVTPDPAASAVLHSYTRAVLQSYTSCTYRQPRMTQLTVPGTAVRPHPPRSLRPRAPLPPPLPPPRSRAGCP
jgi:hypothetical protein